jgi:serine/threonine protein phosphatase PrpC
MSANTPTPTSAPPVTRKPTDQEIDVYGLTHPGKVRKTNQDHFLVASLRKSIDVHYTSLPDSEKLVVSRERIAFLVMVADGVGGGAGGEQASRFALEQASQYVSNSLQCYYSADAREEAFQDMLQQAAQRVHASMLEQANADPELRGMATTLTLFLGVWPWAYLLQVGDSRYYLYREGRLTQVSRDQTMAQALLDQGVITQADLERSPWGHVLSSAIGGKQTEPVVTRLRSDWRNVHLWCTDGLTKHVSDERIRERLGGMQSAKHACEMLLQDALDGGGSDNVTIIVGRTMPQG